MISPSEDTRKDAWRLPVRLMGAGARTVSRLEFYPLERPAALKEVEFVEEAAGAEVLLKEEVAELDGRLRSQEEEISARLDAARSEARSEARLEWEQELEQKIAEKRLLLLKVGEEFRRERARYFAGVEGEVVKLALAIAARVLHREAKLDPLLLAGVVRVALEKVAEDSSVVLRVSTSELAAWKSVFVTDQELPLKLVGDDRLGVGECALDTNVGRVELGVSAQLEEIERGFFDLMQQRPA
jgi:flagellar assembly protein FliH